MVLQSGVERLRAMLNPYFEAVKKQTTTESKLEGIVNTFSQDCVIVGPTGKQFLGHEGVRQFYGSPLSPVTLPGFQPIPKEESICVNENTNTIAIEIVLQATSKFQEVGDFFTFDNVGLIKTLKIYTVMKQ